MMKVIVSVASVVAAALACGFVQASTISLNVTEFNGGNNIVSEPYGVVSASNWTNGNAASFTDLIDDSGAATTMDVNVTKPGGVASFGAPYANTPMFSGPQVFAGGGALELTEIPYGNYYAIVYLTGFTGNTGASVTDGTTTYFWQTPNPHDATLVQTTDTNSGDGYDVANYAQFGSVGTPLTAASLTFTFTKDSGGGAGIGAVQIVEVIPEPATCLLGAFAGLAVCVTRSKQTR